LKGAVVGAAGAAAVGALAIGAVAVGVPAVVVTAGLAVASIAGIGTSVGYITQNIVNNNWNAVAFNIGSWAGGAALGTFGGGRLLAEGINGTPSPNWNMMNDFEQRFDPAQGPIPGWVATGTSPGSAAGSQSFIATGITDMLSVFGKGIGGLLSGCG
jgi:hypothetical protein